MSSNLVISKYVTIRNGQLLVDGNVALQSDAGLAVKDLFKAWYNELGIEYPKFFKMDSLCQLAFLGSELLLKDTEVLERYPKDSIAILLSNSSASLDTDQRYHDTISNADAYFPSPAVFVYTLPSIMCGEIAIRNGIQGENNFLATQGFDALLLVQQTEIFFSQTDTKVCLMGWVQLEGNDYELTLCLVEESKGDFSLQFNVDSLIEIYSR